MYVEITRVDVKMEEEVDSGESDVEDKMEVEADEHTFFPPGSVVWAR